MESPKPTSGVTVRYKYTCNFRIAMGCDAVTLIMKLPTPTPIVADVITIISTLLD